MGVNFEEYKSMSEDDLSYLVAEKKAEFQRTKIDLDLAFTSLGQLESREKKALASAAEKQEAYDKASKRVADINKTLDSEKTESIFLLDTVETLKEEQEKAEDEIKNAAATIGISNAELDSLDSDLEKVKLESALADEEFSDAQKALDTAKKAFDEKQALQAVEYYREYFRADGIFENVVYEGIPEMLSELKRRDAVVALATSKPYEFSVSILDHFDLHQYFDFVGAATMDGRISWKADVIRHLIDKLGAEDKSSVLMIGDRDQDIDGAKANGLQSAGVLWGYGSKAELMNAEADYLVSTPLDIVNI